MRLGLLPCLSDCHVHAVYDPAEQYPHAVCGARIVLDSNLADPIRISMCRRCATQLEKTVELHPALNQWAQLHRAQRIGRITLWWRTYRHSHRIRCVMAAEARR